MIYFSSFKEKVCWLRAMIPEQVEICRGRAGGGGVAFSVTVNALFRGLPGIGDRPRTKASPCRMQPATCLTRRGDCLLRGACEGADPMDQVVLLPWLAVVGIPAGGVVFALLPP
jgi:hypothetical protein